MNRILLLLFLAIRPICVFSQDTAHKNPGRILNFNAYADLYYQVSDEGGGRPAFLYNFKNNNSIRANLILVKASCTHKKWKTSLGLMSGDYAKTNLAAESHFFQYIYEANLNYHFSSKFDLQAGILPSHIGLESAISGENWNLSRSVLAENTPYYETGLKLNYAASEKTKLSLLLINGWQHIRDDNHYLSFGTQVQITISPKTSLNSSTYFGKEGPDSVSRFRAFHNFYYTYKKDKKNSLSLLFDVGIQQKKGSQYSTFWGTAILYQYRFCPDISAATRIEFYNDNKGAVITYYKPGGLSIFSYSFNVDYVKFKWIILRLESRFLHTSKSIFENASPGSRKNLNLLVCTSIYF